MSIGAVAGLIVGLVLVVSGIAKLSDRGWKERERALGTTPWVLPFIAPIEIVIGALVAVRVNRLVLGFAAGALFCAFTFFLILKWDERRGESCDCFGAWSKKPVSWKTIARNVVLIAGSVVAALVP